MTRHELHRWGLCCLAWLGLAASPVIGQDWLLKMKLNGKTVEGGPVVWNESVVHLFERDGRLTTFSPREASDFHKVSSTFRSYTQGQMRAHLIAEFGKGYEVSGTGHYLVVHPAGQKSKWAQRFENLYRSFLHYFTARGWRPQKAKFPLVAVVFPTQQQFLRHSSRNGGAVGPGVLGYYSRRSNRIFLYDVTSDRGDEESWHVNAETIIHEAAHQTAFNVGIHNRVADTPRWVAEGLGTLFEAKGVWDSRNYSSRQHRINRERFEYFQQYAQTKRPKGALASFISNDNLFKTDTSAAYAEAWALTFFLTETRPRKYLKYLAMTEAIKPFKAYSAPKRLAHFRQVFGDNLAILESHFLRFMKETR